MKRKWKIALAATGGALLTAATAFQWSRNNYEEPSYEVVADHGSFSVRRYAARVVAQTTVAGDEDRVTSEGFRRLAGYIFGGNGGQQSIAMTTPVEREAEGSQTIAMTTPVERSPSDDGFVVTFTMPSEYSLESLPAPDDPRVELRELPPKTVAVLRFSGRADLAAKESRAAELRALLEAHGLEADGDASLAQYDPPWVLGIFRRNEIHIPVRLES